LMSSTIISFARQKRWGSHGSLSWFHPSLTVQQSDGKIAVSVEPFQF